MPAIEASSVVWPPVSTPAWAQRAGILLLPTCLIALWLSVLATGSGRVDALGNPVGGDFAMFYVAGQTAHEAQWNDLYDEAQQQQRLLELIPGLPPDTYLPYRYPPLVAIIASPLARLPYENAFAAFSLVSVSLWLASIYWLVRCTTLPLSPSAVTALLAIACAPVAVQTLIDGQASLFWFALAAGCWCCIQRERYALAGCFLALAACKPNVMLLFAVALCIRYPRMLVGLIPTGTVMLAVTLALTGRETLLAYVELGKQLAWKPWLVETPYWKVQSLLSWSEPLFGSAARRINMLSGVLGAIGLGIWWRRQRSTSAIDVKALNAALVLNALFNPYTPVYDLTLLCLGLAAACLHADAHGKLDIWLARRDVQCTVGLVLIGPILSQAVARTLQCPLQLMPLGLLVVGVYWLTTLARQTAAKLCCTIS